MSEHIVHISRSPLAGAPSRLVSALNRAGVKATLLRQGNISDAQRAFEPNAVAFNAPNGDVWDFCVETVRSASVVHFHNQASVESLRLLADSGTRAAIVFHFHSPPAERPNFFNHSEYLPVPPAITLVVPHFHPRCYWDAVAIPNIVEGPPSPPTIRDVTPPIVMFSPSHRDGGTWNAKSDAATEDAIAELNHRKDVRVVVAEGVPFHELIQRRCSAAFSIDEVVTGSYHQVSLEALACGSVAINNADDLAMATFRMAYGVDEPPPFLRCGPAELPNLVIDLARQVSDLEEARRASRSYFERNMRPELLVPLYLDLYRSL